MEAPVRIPKTLEVAPSPTPTGSVSQHHEVVSLPWQGDESGRPGRCGALQHMLLMCLFLDQEASSGLAARGCSELLAL